MNRRNVSAFGGLILGLLLGMNPDLAHAQGETADILVVSKPPPPAVPSDPPQGLIFSLRGDMSASSVTFDTQNTVEGETANVPQSLEYLRLDDAGDAYVTFDDGPDEAAPGGVMVIEDFLNRAGFDASRDRLVTGEAAGLVGPKDLALAGSGEVIVSDFAGAKLAVFDRRASGDAAPRFVTTELGLAEAGPRRPWGLAYHAAADRLFVGGTDGTVLVFDDYLVDRGENGPDRVITPFLGGEQASANTHDLVYLADEDLLIATDVGAATTADQDGFDADGKVFVIGNASTVEGETEVRAQLAGSSTMLGNPVGAAFGGGAGGNGGDLFVTEKTRDTVLRFSDVLSMSGAVNAAPTGAVTVAKPEAVALVSDTGSD